MRIDADGGMNMNAMHQVLSNANQTKTDLEIKQIAADEVTLSAARGKMPELSSEQLIRSSEGAQSMANETGTSIRQDSNMAIMAQANLSPQRVLELLR